VIVFDGAEREMIEIVVFVKVLGSGGVLSEVLQAGCLKI
jgi:hypothetical protein